jgi:acyl carrier protein
MPTVHQRLTSLLEDNFAIPKHRLTPQKTLADLGLDSLERADLGFFIEREFGFTIDWNEAPWAEVVALGQLEFAIEKKIATAAGARARAA